MRCEHCDQADRHPVRRAKLAESVGKVAIVLDVPMEECPSCGDRWLRWEIAARLDELFSKMLTTDIELAMCHFDSDLTAV